MLVKWANIEPKSVDNVNNFVDDCYISISSVDIL